MAKFFDDVFKNDELLSGDEAISKMTNEGLPTVVNNGLEETPQPPTTSARVMVHFRRHAKWKDYMDGAINGTTAASKDDLLYGFDWLGDEHYDFGKTDVLTDRKGRYNYIFNNVSNSISNPNTNVATKTTKLMHDRSHGSVDNFVTAESNLKNGYKQGASITTVNGKEYLPAWMALKYDREVKISLGLRNEAPSTDPQFGNNDDIIHLIPETGYEDAYTITPKEIKKADLASGSVEITLKCVQPTDANISIIAYHTDSLTAKEADGSINIDANGTKVGELRMMKNDENFFLDITIVKVKQRNNHFNSRFGAFASQAEVEKILRRGLGQGMITCVFSIDTIDKDDGGNRLKVSTDTSLGGVSGYNSYINNQYLYKVYVAKIAADNTANGTSITAVSYATFKANTAGVKTPFETKKQFLLFMHDYSHAVGTSRINGAADSVETTQTSSKGKWASVFKTANKQTLIHETAHTLGLPHTFNLYPYKNKINYYEINASGGRVQHTVDLFASGKKGVYFSRRNANARHLFVRGSTENIMDYSQKHKWDESVFTECKGAHPPAGTVYFARTNSNKQTKIYGCGNITFYEKGTVIANPKKRISFWQWQWQLLQADDEVITREVAVKIEFIISPIILVKPPTPTAIIKVPVKIN